MSTVLARRPVMVVILILFWLSKDNKITSLPSSTLDYFFLFFLSAYSRLIIEWVFVECPGTLWINLGECINFAFGPVRLVSPNTAREGSEAPSVSHLLEGDTHAPMWNQGDWSMGTAGHSEVKCIDFDFSRNMHMPIFVSSESSLCLTITNSRLEIRTVILVAFYN